jgi:group I intron endonuclease
MIGIYAIRQISTGRVYVGSSVNIKKRWQVHLRQLDSDIHHSVFLQRSWNKSGSSDFAFEILEQCSKEQLIERENFHMKVNLHKLLNSNKRASLGFSGVHSEESKAKMSSSFSIERRKQISERMKIRMSNLSTEQIEKYRQTSSGRRHSEESKQKISKAVMGKINPPQNIAATKEANSKKVQHIQTGKIFNSFTEAGLFFGCSRVTIKNKIGKEFLEVIE